MKLKKMGIVAGTALHYGFKGLLSGIIAISLVMSKSFRKKRAQ